MDGIFVFLVFFVITWAIYGIFDLLIRKKERIMMIERMNDGVPPVDYTPIPSPFKITPTGFGSLRGACLLMGLGLGFLVGFLSICFARFYAHGDHWFLNKFEGIIVVASVCFFAGLGLLISFLVERKSVKKE